MIPEHLAKAMDCQGKSDGLPRQNINCEKQSEDAFDAVTYATFLTPQVDATRIALCK